MKCLISNILKIYSHDDRITLLIEKVVGNQRVALPYNLHLSIIQESTLEQLADCLLEEVRGSNDYLNKENILLQLAFVQGYILSGCEGNIGMPASYLTLNHPLERMRNDNRCLDQRPLVFIDGTPIIHGIPHYWEARWGDVAGFKEHEEQKPINPVFDEVTPEEVERALALNPLKYHKGDK